jgi:hypothetical protein
VDGLRHAERVAIAHRRIANILRRHVVATDRILEQKISDAGPNDQRIDPHILTVARKDLITSGRVANINRGHTPWYHLTATDTRSVASRLDGLHAIHEQTLRQPFTVRVGQALEIAVYRALLQQTALEHYGGFRDLEEHDDSTSYKKHEPPNSRSGRSIHPKNLDFLVHTSSALYAGIEVKNIRQWIYPDRDEVRDFLFKCCTLDVVPVLIARRIHYSTFSVLNPCGVIIHQTYNQLYPNADAALAETVRRKDLLGYHDVRLGNEPDNRLTRFITKHLPALLPAAHEKFERFNDLLLGYATSEHSYQSFAARVKRRARGEPEDLPAFEQPGDESGEDEYDL